MKLNILYFNFNRMSDKSSYKKKFEEDQDGFKMITISKISKLEIQNSLNIKKSKSHCSATVNRTELMNAYPLNSKFINAKKDCMSEDTDQK